jgi:putative membrane protein
MLTLLLHWFLSALSLLIVAHIVPGFEVQGFSVALFASLVIGLINSTLGLLLPALLGAVVLALVHLALRALVAD